MQLAYIHHIVTPETRLDWLRNLGILTVIDVGANDGEFAANIAETLPAARVISFEPLRDAFAGLTKNCSGPRFRAFNFALGDADGEAVIRRSAFSPSSSLLKMSDLHVAAFGDHTAEEGTERVEVRRLDSLHLHIRDRLLVKLDVQGFEDRVIRGGRETIGRAACVITEVSFEPLYEGQPLFDDINAQLTALEFRFHGCLTQLPDRRDGLILQADAIYLRPGLTAGTRS